MDSSINLLGCHQLFKETLPTIQEIASFQVAVSLWYNFFFDGNFDEDEDELGDSLNEKYRKEVEKSLRNFTSPNLIQDLIKEAMVKIENEIDGWIYYTKYETLPRDQIIILRSHLNCLAWQFNGKIDYRQSARNMLLLDDLNKVEKFAIMCKYCLENEIKNLIPSPELESFFVEVDFESSPLIFYWICYLKNEPGNVPVDANYGSLENFMIIQNEVDNWYAIEYFWSRLNKQDQITKAARLLIKWPIVKFQKQFLSQMNDFQLREVFSRIPVDIVVNFWTRLGEPETAFTIWIRIKNLLSGEQFSALVARILDSEEYIPLMVRLWDSAEDHHKRYFLDQKKEVVIKYYFMSKLRSLSHCLKFLYAVLSYSSPSYRKQIILEHGDNLVANDDFSEVDKIIKLCLPNDDEVINFKKHAMKSIVVRNRCNQLFERGEFNYLNKFVEFYSPDESFMKEYKKLILESKNIDTVFIFSLDRWTELEKLVDDVYSDPELAYNVKQRLILASGMTCFYDWKNIEFLHQLINVTTQFLNNEDTIKLKESLLDKFRSSIMEGYYWESFNEIYWQEFTSWCLGSEEKIKEFKSTLSIDKIFDTIMGIMMLRYIYRNEFSIELLSVLDNFLKWYLVDAEEVKKYKLGRVLAFNDLEIIEASIARREEQYTKTLLLWFLEKDEEQIRKFKSEFSDETVSNII